MAVLICILLICTHVDFFASCCKAHLVLYAILSRYLLVDSSMITDSKNATTSVCVGETLTFNCSVHGQGTTVWKGSALECTSSNNEIVLLHSRYNTTNGVKVICSDGNLVLHAESLSVENGYYTSQINVQVNSELTRTTLTIDCFHDDGAKEELVESYSVAIKSSDGSSTCTGNASLGDVQSDMTDLGITIICVQVFFFYVRIMVFLCDIDLLSYVLKVTHYYLVSE